MGTSIGDDGGCEFRGVAANLAVASVANCSMGSGWKRKEMQYCLTGWLRPAPGLPSPLSMHLCLGRPGRRSPTVLWQRGESHNPQPDVDSKRDCSGRCSRLNSRLCMVCTVVDIGDQTWRQCWRHSRLEQSWGVHEQLKNKAMVCCAGRTTGSARGASAAHVPVAMAGLPTCRGVCQTRISVDSGESSWIMRDLFRNCAVGGSHSVEVELFYHRKHRDGPAKPRDEETKEKRFGW